MSAPVPITPRPSIADEFRANPLSYLTWSWLNPVIRLGRQRPLEHADLGALAAVDQSAVLAHELMQRFARKPPGRGSNLHFWLCLAALQAKNATFGSIAKEIGDLCALVGPISLQGIVNFVAVRSRGGTDTRVGGLELGYWWVIATFVAAVLQTLSLHHSYQAFIRAGLQSKQAVGFAVYRKALRLSAGQRIVAGGSGRIQNLVSTDTNAVNLAWQFVNYSWASLIQIALAMALLYGQLGPPAFVALGVMLLFIPLQGAMAGYVGRQTRATLAFTDKRLRLVTEVVTGVRLLKFFAWEDRFRSRVEEVRSLELAQKLRTAVLGAVNSTIVMMGPALIALLTFVVYGVTSPEPLTATRAFSSLALFNIMRISLVVLPQMITTISAGAVSGKRIADFLAIPELPEARSVLLPSPPPQGPGGAAAVAVSLRGATLRYSAPEPPALSASGPPASASATAVPAAAAADSHAPFALQDLTLDIAAGQLTTVVGSVGSGKTSLLAALLGELSLDEGGSVAFAAGEGGALPHIAYCAQQPWILNATVKANITFMEPWDERRYAAVLHACALTHDLEILPAGDATEIGERGVTLSGGQKARISLARAAYSRCPIVLLDDVLAAVDAHVAAHIFRHAIRGLLRGRTLVFASHQLQFVPASDAVVVLDAGRVHASGSFAEVMDGRGLRGGAAAEAAAEAAPADVQVSVGDAVSAPPQAPRSSNLLRAMMSDRADVDAQLAATTAHAAPPPLADLPPAAAASSDALVEEAGDATPVSPSAAAASSGAATPVALAPALPDTLSAAAAAVKPGGSGGELIHAEDREHGAVPAGIYWTYLASFGGPAFNAMALSLVLTTGVSLGTDVWLSAWSTGRGGFSLGLYLGAYAALTTGSALLSLCYSLSWARGGVNAARKLHSDMLRCILRSPMSFFDTTPVGRIINRFSTDVTNVDAGLPAAFSAYLTFALRIVGTVTMQAIILPWILLGLLLTAAIAIFVVGSYRASAREVKRLESISRSPVFAHLEESLSGLSSVRAYGAQRRFETEAHERLDANMVASLKGQLLNRWLGVRLDASGIALVTAVCLASTLSAGSLDPGLVGLMLSYALTVSGSINLTARFFSDTETQLSSVERIQHYAHLPVEKPPIVEGNRPPPDWPAHGAIDITNLVVRYRPELPPVLKGISVRIAAGEKVGVAGRTGSGKSSLMLALFRIVEAEAGRIVIDGVDTARIGLDDLRSRIAIIPQDPVLFSGTVRYNLDPMGAYTDLQLWESLDRVGLHATVTDMGAGLDSAVEDGGSNLSSGQRQLLSMARALLRRARLMVLDEATASLDNASDAVLQRVLRGDALRDCTLLVIAHRIHTIADSDKILILDDGSVAEFDTPGNLLQRPESIFSTLVAESSNASEKV